MAEELTDRASIEQLRVALMQLSKSANMYMYLRDPRRSIGTNPELAALWEELITNDCVGERFDAVVERMMELDP